MNRTLEPGATLGVIGGGQLGRYFVLSARQHGYRCLVLEPDADAPAMQVADEPVQAAYDDEHALQTLADRCDAVTIEFENVPARALEVLERTVRVLPSSKAVAIAQDRLEEKSAAQRAGLKSVPHAAIRRVNDIATAILAVPGPWVLKTARLGYDGKGQQRIEDAREIEAAFESMAQVPCVLEQRIELAAEISVVLARGLDGTMACFPVAENTHRDGILDTSSVPAMVSEDLQDQAREAASRFAEALDYHGVLAVEFFISASGELLFNEMAPRPHNSAHYTLDATVCSQFEQQWRVLCAMPLGEPRLLSAVTMQNLLGDAWAGDVPPDWRALLAEPGACLHLYGKAEARPGRKMGHINRLRKL